MSDNALAVIEQGTILPAQSQSTAVMSMIERAALDPNFNVEKLNSLFQLKQQVEADEARKQYNAAFAAFKSEAVAIIKNITVTDGPLKGKRYADLFAVVSAVTPALSRHGLSHSWKLTKDEPSWLEVTCTLRHELGHTESVSMGGPPDTGGAKNAIQARASSKSYLERYTLLAITGMAAQFMDTDGNEPRGMDAMELGDWLEGIAQASDLTKLQKVYTDALKAAKAANDAGAQRDIIAAKDARKKELQ